MTRAAFAFIFATVMLDMLAIGLMAPVLPKLMVLFEAGDHSRAAEMTGLFGFAWASMQFIFSPLLGSLSDRFGRRPVLLISCAGMAADYVLMALAPNLGWLFVGRLLSGVTSATLATSSAYIADITPPAQRAGRFGMLGAAFGLGFIIGPAVGGWLGHFDLRLPFWASAGLCLVNALYGFFVLPESLPPEKRTAFQWKVANPLGAVRLLSAAPGGLAMTGAVFLSQLAHESLPSMFVLYTDYRFQWSEARTGAVLGAVGLSSMFIQAGLTRRLVARWGELPCVWFGSCLASAGFALYGWATQENWFLLGIPLVALGGVMGPAMQSWLSSRSGDAAQGQLQGAIGSMRGVAGMLGPPLFTLSFAYAKGLGLVAGLPYYLASLFMGLCCLLALLTGKIAGTKRDCDDASK